MDDCDDSDLSSTYSDHLPDGDSIILFQGVVYPWNRASNIRMDDPLNVLHVFWIVYQQHLQDRDLGSALDTLLELSAVLGGNGVAGFLDDVELVDEHGNTLWQDLPTVFRGHLPGVDQFEVALTYAAKEPIQDIKNTMEMIQWNYKEIAFYKRSLGSSMRYWDRKIEHYLSIGKEACREIEEVTGIQWEGGDDEVAMRAALGDRKQIDEWAEALRHSRRMVRSSKEYRNELIPTFLEDHLQNRRFILDKKLWTQDHLVSLRKSLQRLCYEVLRRWRLAQQMNHIGADFEELFEEARRINR